MQTSTAIIDTKLNVFKSRGTVDAKMNHDIGIDEGRIKPAARDAYYKIKAHLSGLKERLNVLISHDALELEEVNSDFDTAKKSYGDMESITRTKVFLYYTLPGWAFVFGDIMFSKELVVKGWGLGGSGIYKSVEQWVLAVAIGLAPFFSKLLIDRFFEPNLEHGSSNLKKLITGFYLFLGAVVIFSFCQIAYVRGIFFRFMKTDTGETNLYNELFQFHGSSMSWAFILVALMFIICGSFLLSISSKQLAKIRKRDDLGKELEGMRIRKSSLNSNLAEHKSKLQETHTLLSDWMNKDECIEHLENELRFSYKNGFTQELLVSDASPTTESGDLPEFQEGAQGFHHYTKYLIDKYSMNEKGNTNHAN